MYLFSIFICVLIVGLFSSIITFEIYQSIAWSFIVTLIVLVVDGITAFIIRKLLSIKFFGIDKQKFIAKQKEIKFYDKIKIKKWKDKVLELGFLAGFSKNKIIEPSNNEYVKRYIIEANYGVSVHFYSMIFGFLVVFACPKKFWLSIGLPVAIVNVFYNFLSFAILRYNLVKLHKLYKINEIRNKRKNIDVFSA